VPIIALPFVCDLVSLSILFLFVYFGVCTYVCTCVGACDYCVYAIMSVQQQTPASLVLGSDSPASAMIRDLYAQNIDSNLLHSPARTSTSTTPTTTMTKDLHHAPIARLTVSGALAGVGVEMTLFPLDTIKTRLQSPAGFQASGGFRGVYAGLGSSCMGAVPGCGLFFMTYEVLTAKFASIYHHIKQSHTSASYNNKSLNTALPPFIHVAAVIGAEIVAIAVRVPTDNMKQKMQAGQYGSIRSAYNGILHHQGYRGFFNGYLSTLTREVPFAVIQFPLYEKGKDWIKRRQHHDATPLQAALCGSAAGAIASAITTPFDTIKTRIMLSTSREVPSIMHTARDVYREGGMRLLYTGTLPRVAGTSLGGLLLFGAYEKAKLFFADYL
jgi:solute carrier family 25 S-adenosylmethionine transporter 26